MLNDDPNVGPNDDPNGNAILARQSSASPVAPACTIDDDSKGSIARDRFNLVLVHQLEDR